MSKKVLFIQPFQFVKKNLSNELLMWFIYLENYLNARINNMVSDIIYLPAENNGSGDFLPSNNLKKFHFVLDNAISKLEFNLDDKTYICISGISFDYLGMKLVAEYFQHNFPESIIVSGGYHASSCPNDFIYSNSPFDYVVIGEGENALYNLISNESKKRKLPTIIEGTLFNSLDDLPPLDITLLDKYIDYIRTQARGLSISLSRGCPHNCSYCIEESLAEGKKIKRWRSYTPKRAVQETNTIINYGLNQDIKYYGFLDPCFGYNKNWLNKFLDQYKVDEQVIHHYVETRIDILNEQLISNLQKKKMFQFYGVETFSKRILGIMNKTHNPPKFLNQLENVLAIHNNLEYKCSIGLITNHPGETRETIQESFTYLSKIAESDNNDLFNFVPILYHLFAKTANYEKLEILNQRYGTKVYFPEWWKELKTLKLGAFAIRPSSDLSLRDSINLFVENHLEIDRSKYEKNMKEGFGLFLAKASILKKQRKELIKFLDENNIEMEESIINLV